MADYRAPIDDMRFVLREIADIEGLSRLPGMTEMDAGLVDQILEEAGKQAAETLGPLNATGDRTRVHFDNGVVRVPDGFAEAYGTYVDSGWNALPFEPEYGGQGLPWTIALALTEMWNGANMSWALCPLLTVGAVELLQAHGSPWQKETFLPKLISGQWSGTMNLTEPQAGSDVGALKTRAVKKGDHYRITGQKIYITWGEHEMAENIVHMVLARTPDAPPGTKGISLFIVPKYLPREDGSPGPRNDLRCVSLEDKLGIHASPTCTMAFGDAGGAIGYLVGEENRGMAYMFTMMNNARLTVGVQGVGIAERAYQDARAYAVERVQSRAVDGGGSGPVPVVRHPDVRRMLLTMKAQVEAMRALTLYAGAALDRAKHEGDDAKREAAQARIDVLTPVAKAWCTDTAIEVASTAIQVHGGMGYVEETGVAQHYRDARIAPIYEGTNGIQAMDLLGRKLLRDEGRAVNAVVAEFKEMAAGFADADAGGADMDKLYAAVDEGLAALESATRALLAVGRDDIAGASALAMPYLQLFGSVAGGALLTRAAACASARMTAGAADRERLQAKVATARFYVDHLMPRVRTYAAQIENGGEAIISFPEAWL